MVDAIKLQPIKGGFMRRAKVAALLGVAFTFSFGLGPVAAAPSLHTLYTFTAKEGNGGFPGGGLARGANGVLYGFGTGGGIACNDEVSECGSAFELVPPANIGDPWQFSLLWNFQGGKDGYFEGDRDSGTPFLDSQGNVFGVAKFGGTSKSAKCQENNLPGCGVVFELTPPKEGETKWSETIIWNFTGNADGGYPSTAGLIADGAGAFYGASAVGGKAGTGTVFKLVPPIQGQTKWTEETLYNFLTGEGLPSKLSFDASGAIYGVLGSGGKYSGGAVFKLVAPINGGASWTRTTIFNPDDGLTGQFPTGGLTIGPMGQVYGVTEMGGSRSGGTAFELTPIAGNHYKYHKLWNFGVDDAYYPQAPLLLDSNGNLFGTTLYQYMNGYYESYGVVWKLTPKPTGLWSRTILKRFNGYSNGAFPYQLVADPQGVLYGMTSSGTPPPYYAGTIYSLTGSGYAP